MFRKILQKWPLLSLPHTLSYKEITAQQAMLQRLLRLESLRESQNNIASIEESHAVLEKEKKRTFHQSTHYLKEAMAQKSREELLQVLNGIRAENRLVKTEEEQFHQSSLEEAARHLLNPGLPCTVILSRGWFAEKTRRIHDEALGHKVFVMHEEEDTTTPAVQNTPPEQRILIESYTHKQNILDHLIKLKEQHGSVLVHLGVGFWSENPAFVAECASRGITCLSAPAKAMAAFADKEEAKKIANELGVPIPKTFFNASQIENLEELADQVQKEIGSYPFMIKTCDGGGGTGNRIANDRAELIRYIGDLRKPGTNITIEKYLKNAEHIEFQIMYDKKNGWVIGVRNCTTQREGQKNLEKNADAHYYSGSLKQDVFKLVQIGKKLGYRGAETIEFLVDETGQHYFMERNTRLQVEHTLTDMVTGVSLFEWHTRVLLGESTENFLLEKLENDESYFPEMPSQYWLDEQIKNAAPNRHVRIYAVDVMLDARHKGDVLYAGKTGVVTDIELPEDPEVIINLDGITRGTALNPFHNAQIGYVVLNTKNKKMSQEDVDKKIIETLGKIKIKVDGKEAKFNLDHIQFSLAQFSQTKERICTTSWKSIDAEYAEEFRLQNKNDECLEENTSRCAL